mmetsp:Transcript_28603/g.52845  ORF Transcript_28603/g.52845 Transcript_28603/m.52845 type:complete len:80 (+) Transcript_28603:1074-1313(+)
MLLIVDRNGDLNAVITSTCSNGDDNLSFTEAEFETNNAIYFEYKSRFRRLARPMKALSRRRRSNYLASSFLQVSQNKPD